MSIPYSFSYIALASMSSESNDFKIIGGTWFELLDRMNGQRTSTADFPSDEPLVFLILTGGTEQKVQNAIEHLKPNSNYPVLLMAHPGNNALPASLETLAWLRQNKIPGKILLLSSPDDTQTLSELSEFMQLCVTHKKMKHSRIGLVGQASDWLIASQPDPATLTKIWGTEVLSVDMEALVTKMTEPQAEPNLSAIEQFINQAITIDGPDKTDFRKSTEVYSGLQEIAKQLKLSALSVRCFDLVEKQQTTGCFALAQLNDDHLVSGCEGDVLSTLGMLWAKYLLNAKSWMANPAYINTDEKLLRLAHCTIALGMTTSYDILSHFETNIGIGIRGYVNPQPCTVFRLGGKNTDELWIMEGNITNSGESAFLCRTQLDIVTDDTVALQLLLNNPLGNHVVMVFGHHKTLLTNYHNMFVASNQQK